MDLNGILIGSENPQRLTDYYTKLFGKPGWDEGEGGYVGWQIGSGSITVGPHDQVKGKNSAPGRVIWNIQTSDVNVLRSRRQLLPAHEPDLARTDLTRAFRSRRCAL
jgi:hypothetical protein